MSNLGKRKIAERVKMLSNWMQIADGEKRFVV